MKKIFIILLIYLNLFSYSKALIKVDITRGNLDPLPIAVSPLHVDSASENLEKINTKKLGVNISAIIEKNFKAAISGK